MRIAAADTCLSKYQSQNLNDERIHTNLDRLPLQILEAWHSFKMEDRVLFF